MTEISPEVINAVDNIYKLMDDNNVEHNEKLIATLYACGRVSYAFLKEVLNKHYYPLLEDEHQSYLITKYLAYVLTQCLYPYTKDSSWVHKAEREFLKIIESYCAEHYLVYILDHDSLLQNTVNYLYDLCLKIY